MLTDALRKIGLTPGEAKIYLGLLEIGLGTSGKITRKCGISGSKVYEVLDRLMEKGLASCTDLNGVKHFEAASPHRIVNYLTRKEEDIQVEKTQILSLMPELLLKQKGSAKSEVKVFMGFEGIKTVNEDIIETLHKGQEWLSMGLSSQPPEWEAYFNRRQVERARKGIVQKHLLNEQYRSLYTFRKKLPHTQFRFLPKALEMPTSTEVYANKVAIMILLKENPFALLIENAEVAKSFKKYFYVMWEIGKIPSIQPKPQAKAHLKGRSHRAAG